MGSFEVLQYFNCSQADPQHLPWNTGAGSELSHGAGVTFLSGVSEQSVQRDVLYLWIRISGFLAAGAFNLFACHFCANTWIIWFTSSAVHKKWISEPEVLV